MSDELLSERVHLTTYDGIEVEMVVEFPSTATPAAIKQTIRNAADDLLDEVDLTILIRNAHKKVRENRKVNDETSSS